MIQCNNEQINNLLFIFLIAELLLWAVREVVLQDQDEGVGVDPGIAGVDPRTEIVIAEAGGVEGQGREKGGLKGKR